MKKRYLFLILIILSIISLFIGAHSISIGDLLRGNNDKISVFLLSRVPRLISILASGVSLSIAGVIMQQISSNKFVSPTTAATMDSAKLGVLVSTLIFTSATLVQKMIISLIFSLLGTFIFMRVLKRVKFKNVIFVPLVGIMVGNVIGAVTDFLAYKYNLVQNVSSFLQGDFSMIIKGNYELIFFTIPLIFIAFMYAKKFTIVAMGEDMALNLGISYKKVMQIGIIIISLISSLVVITVGNIPYIGLVVPNIVSMYKGDNLSKNIGITALMGGIFVLVCDILGRVIIFPYEVPINLTVGVIGSGIFLYMIIRRNNNEG
ncbi:MAG: iron chelate uptake ABC transporter family permease subunit [Clostridiales bacterium]|nr:iron chelate uptake ABC transporter family permease subunit [Clostridiales bacterium]